MPQQARTKSKQSYVPLLFSLLNGWTTLSSPANAGWCFRLACAVGATSCKRKLALRHQQEALGCWATSRSCRFSRAKGMAGRGQGPHGLPNLWNMRKVDLPFSSLSPGPKGDVRKCLLPEGQPFSPRCSLNSEWVPSGQGFFPPFCNLIHTQKNLRG